MKTAAALIPGDVITVDTTTRTVTDVRRTDAMGGRIVVSIDRPFEQGAPFFVAHPQERFAVGGLHTSW